MPLPLRFSRDYSIHLHLQVGEFFGPACGQLKAFTLHCTQSTEQFRSHTWWLSRNLLCMVYRISLLHPLFEWLVRHVQAFKRWCWSVATVVSTFAIYFSTCSIWLAITFLVNRKAPLAVLIVGMLHRRISIDPAVFCTWSGDLVMTVLSPGGLMSYSTHRDLVPRKWARLVCRTSSIVPHECMVWLLVLKISFIINWSMALNTLKRVQSSNGSLLV